MTHEDAHELVEVATVLAEVRNSLDLSKALLEGVLARLDAVISRPSLISAPRRPDTESSSLS